MRLQIRLHAHSTPRYRGVCFQVIRLMGKSYRYRYRWITFTALLSGCAMAQEGVASSIPILDAVVVQAPKEDLAPENTAASVSHFDQQEIDRLNVRTLGDLFRYEPGISVDEGPTGALNDIRIRGIDADRVLILVDDVPLPPGYEFGRDVSTNRNFFDLDAMKLVDVVKGPMSTLYGGSALAGGVFMRTKDPEDFIAPAETVGGEARLSWQSRSREFLAGVTLAAHLGDDLSAFIRLTQSRGHELSNHLGRGGGHGQAGLQRKRPDPADTRMSNVLTKVVYNAGLDHRFSLSYEHFRDQVEQDLLSDVGPGKLMPNIVPMPPMFPYEQLSHHTRNINRREQWVFRHEFERPTGLFDQGYWQADFQNSKTLQESEELRLTGAQPAIPGIANQLRHRTRDADYHYRSMGLAAGLSKQIDHGSLRHHLNHGLSLRQTKTHTLRDGDSINQYTGHTAEHETLPAQGEPDSTMFEASVHFQNRVELYGGRIELIGGLRYDHFRLKPKTGTLYESSNPRGLPPAGIRENRLSKRLAVLFHPADRHTLFANYSEGFKAPRFNDINTSYVNDSYRVIRQANPELQPETSRMFELGWNYRDEHRYISLLGFHTRYRNFIEFRPIGKNAMGYTVTQTVNLDRSRISGFELKAGSDIWRFSSQNVLGVSLAAAWARGRDMETRQPLDSVDPLTITAGLNWNHGERFFGELRLNAVGPKRASNISQTLKNQGVTRNPGYATLDLFGEYKPNRSLVINAGIYNLLDRKYWRWSQRQHLRADAIHRHTQPGINARVSLKYLF